MVFEAGGDWQLARFKRDPANRGKVQDSGLWRYTRYPNHLGDFCVWWSVIGPLLMSLMLLNVSGVALLEKGHR